MKNKLLLILAIVILSNTVSAVLLSDQGTDVKEIATGNLTALANLTISIYDDPSGGNLIFEQNFSGAIVNGSWNIMMNPNLEYGKSYWKDYQINSEDLDFDGNERLEFQSPLGKINNVSFINLSLINSCPDGSSIRMVYENGSVECETDDLGSIETNLTDYALKNQSEIFAGNITTSQTGFFGFLGRLASRITKLFVQDIDASGNINIGNNATVTGNVSASYFFGDGSQLSNLPMGNESDPIFVAENSSLYSAILSKLSETDQRYNETTLILSINTTYNIMSLDFYNKTEIDSLISGVSGGNSSFNQTLTDTLYYSISNPQNFINLTDAQAFNETNMILTTNSSLWSYINANEASWLSTYNATYDAYNSTGLIINWSNSFTDTNVLTDNQYNTTQMENQGGLLHILDSWIESLFNTFLNGKTTDDLSEGSANFYDNRSWNETRADTKYLQSYTETDPYAYNGTLAYNSSLANYYPLSNPYGYLNTTTETLWNANYSTFLTHITWAQAINGTLMLSADWNATNISYYLATNPFGFYNSTTLPPTTETDPKWSANYTAYNSSWSSTYNATYNTWAYNQTTQAVASSNAYTNTRTTTANLHAHDALNITNPTGLNNKILLNAANITNGTFGAGINKFQNNVNMSNQNMTNVNCIVFQSGGRICST